MATILSRIWNTYQVGSELVSNFTAIAEKLSKKGPWLNKESGDRKWGQRAPQGGVKGHHKDVRVILKRFNLKLNIFGIGKTRSQSAVDIKSLVLTLIGL